MPPANPTSNEAAARVTSTEPDAHGQAALLLAESILHTLVETATISPHEAVEIIETACDVKVQVVELTGESQGRMQASLDLLSDIKASFEQHEG